MHRSKARSFQLSHIAAPNAIASLLHRPKGTFCRLNMREVQLDPESRATGAQVGLLQQL